MMTITPERKGVVYITDPYRENVVCFDCPPRKSLQALGRSPELHHLV